jgi:hypothetical protein
MVLYRRLEMGIKFGIKHWKPVMRGAKIQVVRRANQKFSHEAKPEFQIGEILVSQLTS